MDDATNCSFYLGNEFSRMRNFELLNKINQIKYSHSNRYLTGKWSKISPFSRMSIFFNSVIISG